MAITMGQLASRYAKAAKNMDGGGKKLETLAQAGVGMVKRSIQEYHAVDTGTMLNSTVAEQAGKDTYLIGPTVKYAPYVALGTSRMHARPFHKRAAEQLSAAAESIGFSPDDLGI